MKVAVLSDIHANLPALQAVLHDLPPVDARIPWILPEGELQ